MAIPAELRQHAEELQGATGVAVDLIDEPDRIFVVLSKVPLPPGLLSKDASDVLYLADQQYPLSSMDMFWTDVDLVRRDGSVPGNADSIEQYAGRSWRRFSWHRNGSWNPAGNPLLDHHAFMEARWQREMELQGVAR